MRRRQNVHAIRSAHPTSGIHARSLNTALNNLAAGAGKGTRLGLLRRMLRDLATSPLLLLILDLLLTSGLRILVVLLLLERQNINH